MMVNAEKERRAGWGSACCERASENGVSAEQESGVYERCAATGGGV